MEDQTGHYLMKELYGLVRSDPAIFEFLQEGSLDGIWYWDLEDPAVEWLSPRFWQVLGYDPEDKKHLASEWQDLINPDDLQVALKNFNDHCADPKHPYDQIVRYTHKNGSTVWVRCRGIAIRDSSGKPIRMLGAHNDITDLKNAEMELKKQAEKLRLLNEELESLATRDGLTNLYNRRAFDAHLPWSISNARRLKEELSLMLIDLDQLKLINDIHGHAQGDRALILTAQALQGAVRENDFLARVGGDEFVVVLPRTDQTQGLVVGERVRSKIQDLQGNPYAITISVGLTTMSPNEQDDFLILAVQAMQQADQALLLAKAHGRNRVYHYKQSVPAVT
ncbi:MAG: sensor domain-containing diguanylate cyclase [Anaerolineae bacterium]|nr:sensor domain-containing diguanylate cyclase [Anaerolineae bacterium]